MLQEDVRQDIARRRDPLYEDPNTETLTGNKTLLVTDKYVQFLDPGGSNRDVTAPAEEFNEGLAFWIHNRADAAETLTFKDDGGSTIMTIDQNERGIAICDGVNWSGMVGGIT